MEPSATAAKHDGLIVFYDGTCGLCAASVQWCIRQDVHARLRYAPLQGETAKAMLGAMPEGTIVVRVPRESSTAILLRSDAILEIWRTLGGVLGLLSGPGRLVPRIIRDGVYRFIAKRRTRWTPGACVVPGDRPNTIFLP